MELGEKGYRQEEYDEACDWWGVYFLQTNTRSIETCNAYIKNDEDFSALKIRDYYVRHGFDFIMLVTGLIHSRLSEAVRSLQKPGISIFDILVKAGHMRMVLEDGEWRLRNTRKLLS